MNQALAWPDIIIAAIVALGALRGFRRGFVAELSGAIALFVAIVAAFRYQGDWDASIAGTLHLGPGSAHVVASANSVIATAYGNTYGAAPKNAPPAITRITNWGATSMIARPVPERATVATSACIKIGNTG